MGQEYSQPKATLIRPATLQKLTTSRFPCSITVLVESSRLSIQIISPTTTCSWLLEQVRSMNSGLGQICALRTQRNHEMVDYWLLQAKLTIPPLSRSELLLPVFSQPTYGAVSQSHFSPIKLIGRGGFSQVVLCTSYSGRKKNTGALYAMKIMQKGHLRKERRTRQAFSELSLLSKLSHPFIVRMHWAFQTGAAVYFVLDFCPGGELFFHLHNLGRFAEDQARFYFSEVLLAIEYLHTSGVIYRDLKPENILLGLDGHIRIADFGLGKIGVFSGDTTQTFCGSPEYMSPEMLKGEGHGQPLDFYCLGALLYEMLTGLPPFFSANRAKMFKSILRDPLPVPSYISPQARELLLGLMEKKPSRRLGSTGGVKEIKSAKWLSGVPWDKLLHKQCQPPLVPALQASCFSSDYTGSPMDLSAFSACSSLVEDDFSGFEYSEEEESTVLETLSCTAKNVPTNSTPATNLTLIANSPRGSWLTEDSLMQPKAQPVPQCSSLINSPVTSRPASRERHRKQSQEPVRLIDMRDTQFRPVMSLKVPSATIDLRSEKPPKPSKGPRLTSAKLRGLHEKSLRRLSYEVENTTMTTEESGIAHNVPIFSPVCLVHLERVGIRSPSQ